MQGDDVLSVSHQSLVLIAEHLACALFVLTNGGQVVAAQDHILRRNGDRSTIGRVEDVVALEHQHLCLQDSLVAQR